MRCYVVHSIEGSNAGKKRGKKFHTRIQFRVSTNLQKPGIVRELNFWSGNYKKKDWRFGQF